MMTLSKWQVGFIAAGAFLALVGVISAFGDTEAPPRNSAAPSEASALSESSASSAATESVPVIGEPLIPAVASEVSDDVPAAVGLFTAAPRTERGARQAAVAMLELTEEAVQLTPEEAAELERPFATAAMADEAAAQTEERMRDLLAAVPGGITLRIAPMEIHSVGDGEDYVVSVWYVEAITIASDGVVDDWRTAVYRMRWEDDMWKVADFRSSRGPMPGRGNQAASHSPTQFEALLSGFDDEGLN